MKGTRGNSDNEERLHAYPSDIKLGEVYVDGQSGIEGIATAIVFYQHSCERVDIEYTKDGELKQVMFDAARLSPKAKPEETARVAKGGGDSRTSTSRTVTHR